jgi:reverse transcriptase-like protein
MPFDRPTIHRNVRRLQVRIVQATKASRWGKVQTLQRLLIPRNRVSRKEAFEGLELCERKLSCTVLRGLDGSNPVRLLGDLSGTAEQWIE